MGRESKCMPRPATVCRLLAVMAVRLRDGYSLDRIVLMEGTVHALVSDRSWTDCGVTIVVSSSWTAMVNRGAILCTTASVLLPVRLINANVVAVIPLRDSHCGAKWGPISLRVLIWGPASVVNKAYHMRNGPRSMAPA